VGPSQVLAIDGKVDATDAGGDLLTEKLLAHLPLSLVARPRDVCVIGLASGVTAGAALTYPVERLDVLEVSKEVVEASKMFERVNGKPLASGRTRIIVNDGRNHLALTGQQYDAILSEPSNPWISGMNSMFTRDFFRIARSRLKPGGVLAQWFHLYNMPPDDLRSLLRAFTEVFPAATLWQLNEGDVLLTGASGETRSHPLPAAALRDLASIGAGRPELLSTLYIMRGADLVRFADNAEPNTDDWPVLEFHGLRDLDRQTDRRNMEELTGFPQQLPPPQDVAEVRANMSAERLIARARMFEKAESYRLAFDGYRKAGSLAGMLRCARAPEERAAAGTLESRTTEALTDARNGDFASAESLLRAVKEAWPERPETHLNYGVFCLERSRYDDAIQSFDEAIRADPRYLPAFEAMAEAYMHKHDLHSAVVWSRRILEIDPNHESARQALAALERQGAK
jgi:spermidine synthase